MSSRTRSARALLFSGAALLVAALVPAAAAASSVTTSGGGEYALPGVATFEADGGETNTLTISRSGDDLVFNDSMPIETTDCTLSNNNLTATCAPPAGAPFTTVFVALRDGSDLATCNVSTPFDGESFTLVVDAGSGNDTVNGCDTANTQGSDFLSGGAGDDTQRGRGGVDVLDDLGFDDDPEGGDGSEGGNDHFFGGGGRDFLTGGTGDDEVRGEAGDDFIFNTNGADGNDTYDGGSGLDSIAYDFANVDADGNGIVIAADQLGAIIRLDVAAARATTGNGLPGEADTIGAIEDATGSRGADQITGSAAGNVIFGGAGNDTINGAAGNDNLSGGGDADNINSQDGEVDRVSCGGQPTDTAAIDNIDQVSDDCPPAGQGTTVVNVPPPAGPVVIRDPNDETKAVITRASTSRRVKTRKLRRKGRYRFRLRVNEVVTGEFSLSAKLRGGRIATAGYLTLAEKRQTIQADRFTRVTLRIPKRLRRTLRKRRTIRLLMQLRDGGNNITSRRVTIRLT